MSQLKSNVQALSEQLDHMWDYLSLEEKNKELTQLEQQMEKPSFWDDPKAAQKVIASANQCKEWLEPFFKVQEACALIEEMLLDEGASNPEYIQSLEEEYQQALTEFEKLESKQVLSGELDPSPCYLSINAGAGGTESCDWVAMLYRMYQRWVEKRGWKVELIDLQEGDSAGIKSVMVKIEGSYAYGYAKAEKGVHRLVRISPFDSNAKRHTSFASVDVVPEVAEDVEVEIKPEEIRIDTFRSSGAGGQHVNTTDSAVRITHLPTGIVVSCQNQRSQLQNKETCLRVLRSKLYEKKISEQKEALDKLSDKKEIAWGSQIRSYVFHPYSLVKDNRTKHEVGNVQGMMDGDYLDAFIDAYLKQFCRKA